MKDLNKELIIAVKDDNFYFVEKLVEAGADVNKPFGTLANTPLLECLRVKNVPMFKYLVEHGADVTQKIGTVDEKEYERESLLKYAITTSDIPVEIIGTILKNGGFKDINYAPKGKDTPAEIAYKSRNIALLKMFSKYVDIKIDVRYLEFEKKRNNHNKQVNKTIK